MRSIPMTLWSRRTLSTPISGSRSRPSTLPPAVSTWVYTRSTLKQNLDIPDEDNPEHGIKHTLTAEMTNKSAILTVLTLNVQGLAASNSLYDSLLPHHPQQALFEALILGYSEAPYRQIPRLNAENFLRQPPRYAVVQACHPTQDIGTVIPVSVY